MSNFFIKKYPSSTLKTVFKCIKLSIALVVLPTAAEAASTVCQIQSNASYCSNQLSSPASGGYQSTVWTNLNKNLLEISVSDDMVWGVDSNTDLWQLQDFKYGAQQWVKVSTGVKKIAFNGKLLCQISVDSNTYCATSFAPSQAADANGYRGVGWIKTGISALSEIALGGGNQIWGVVGNQDLYLYKDYSNLVTTGTAQMAANVYKVAAGVSKVAFDSNFLCQKNVSSSYCTNSPTPPEAADSNGYHGLPWTDLGTQYSSIAVAAGKVWGVSSTADIWVMPNYLDRSSWYKLAAGGVVVSAAPAPLIHSFASDEVPVLIFMGQSNSAGINNIPAQYDVSNAANVSGITNQGWTYYPGYGDGSTFTGSISSISSITWKNWSHSSAGNTMNLGYSNASGNAADFAAYHWQSLVNAQNNLPNLRVIHIAWPSQGVDALDYTDPTIANWVNHGSNLWQPNLGPSNQPSYAQAPYARRLIYLALRDILSSGKTPRIIGMQWNQWEAETGSATTVANAPANYTQLFQSFYNAAGAHFPIQIVKPIAATSWTPSMQKVFTDLAASAPQDFTVIDVASKLSNPNVIFSPGFLGGGDGGVHYNLDTHLWFAGQALTACLKNEKCGTRITSLTLPGSAPN